MIAQAAVAIIGLTYPVDGGTNWQGTYTQPGIVDASGLTCYADNNKCPTQPEVEQIVAHTYGELASGAPCCLYSDISEAINSDANCPIFCNRTPDHEEYAYRFPESNPMDVARTYPLITNRMSTASSGECIQYDIDPKSGQKVADPDGDLAAAKWAYSNGTVNGSINIP